MKEYYLEFAGLRILLQTPYEITISESLRPFLSRGNDTVDCTIALRSCDRLPGFAEGGIWRGPEYYDRIDGVSRVFFCATAQMTPIGVTQFFENGNISISVLHQHLSGFTGSAGILNHIGIENLLLQRCGLLLHASLIKYAGKAIAFAGPSGVGKSTHADIWKTCLQADILNGDRAALKKEDSGWIAYGAPYAGTSGIYINDSAPLAAIVLLSQAEENRFYGVDATQAFRQLYPELAIHHWDKTFAAKAVDLCLQLMEDVPVYRLECRPEEDAARLVMKGLGL